MRFFLPVVFLLIFLPNTVLAVDLNQINQKNCDRFEENVLRMAAIMEEVRSRKGITETRVAFGGSDTPIKSADYYVNFAAEAIAFQRVQSFDSLRLEKSTGLFSLRTSLETLKNKILTAKNAVGRTLNE